MHRCVDVEFVMSSWSRVCMPYAEKATCSGVWYSTESNLISPTMEVWAIFAFPAAFPLVKPTNSRVISTLIDITSINIIHYLFSFSLLAVDLKVSLSSCSVEGVSTAHMLAVEISLSSCSMHGVSAEQTGPSDVRVL